MPMETVKLTRPDEGLAVVSIDRPERRNALDAATAAGVAEAIQEAAAGARVVILTGEGGAFCAGGDLDEIERWSTQDPEQVGAVLYETFQGMIRAVRSTAAIVIAAVSGAAVGAGMDLALACDLRVAAAGAKLGQVWVRLGLIPGTGGAYLTQALAGPGRAAELLLTGKIVTAEQALELGLVNRVVEPDDLMREARSMAHEIMRHPAEGVAANKRAMIAATEAAVEAALEHAARVQSQRFVSEEFKNAVRRARSG